MRRYELRLGLELFPEPTSRHHDGRVVRQRFQLLEVHGLPGEWASMRFFSSAIVIGLS